jgi:hypothetical protein
VDDGRGPVGVDGGDGVLLVDVRTVLARVVQEELVELGAHDLVGVRAPAGVLAEEEAPRLALPAPEKRAAGLSEEPVTLDGGRRADGVEDRERRREERLADVVAREALALEEDDAMAGVGEDSGADGAGGAAADDGDVGGCRRWRQCEGL